MSEVVKTVSGKFGAAVPGGVQDYYDMGVMDERQRIIKIAQSRICFDHQDNNNCSHGHCFALVDLLQTLGAPIKGENE